MKKLIFALLIFINPSCSEEAETQDIKVSCDCENKKWIIEKIPKEAAEKLFENQKHPLMQYLKNRESNDDD